MPVCKPNSLVRLSGMFGVYVISCIVVWFVLGKFLISFINKLSEHERRNPLNIAAAMIVTLIAIDRGMRFIEMYLIFYGNKSHSFIVSSSTNFLIPIWSGLVSFFLIRRLRVVFEDSIYEVPRKELNKINLLAGLFIFGCTGIVAMNALSRFINSGISQITIAFLALITIVSALISLSKINVSFAQRLRKMVVSQATNSSAPPSPLGTAGTSNQTIHFPNVSTTEVATEPSNLRPPTTPTTPVSTTLNRGFSNRLSRSFFGSPRQSSVTGNNQAHNSNTPAKGTTFIHHNSGASGQSGTIFRPAGHTLNLHSLSSVLQIEGFNRTSLSIFDATQRTILKTSARATVLVMWLTVGCICSFIALLLYSISECLETPVLIGQICFGFHCYITALSVFLSLKPSRGEYERYCFRIDLFIQQMVAYQTNKEIEIELTHNHGEADIEEDHSDPCTL